MELHQLRYFIATAETGSVSRAATRCRVAQPSLSQQIKKLEEGLGARLFDHLGRGMRLTQEGRALLPRARRILAEVRDVETNLKRDLEHGGELAIGAIPTMAPYLLPAALRSVRRELPQCALSVREDLTEALIESLVDDQLDCAIVSTPIASDLVEVEVLGEEELVVVVPADHPRSDQPTITLEHLRGQARLSLREEHCLGRQIEGFCSSRHVASWVVCHTTQLQTILELVALGVGLSIVPEMAGAAAPAGCRFVRLSRQRPTRQIAAAWRRGRTRSAAATLLVQCVRSRLESGEHTLSGASARARRPSSKR